MKISNILTESITFWIPSESNYGVGDCEYCKNGINGYELDIGDEYYHFDERPRSVNELASHILSKDKEAQVLRHDIDWYSLHMKGQTDDRVITSFKEEIDKRKRKYRKYKKIAMKKAKDNLPNVGADECRMCDGKGERERELSDAPELNVSNSNAAVIMKMLGVEYDYSGGIDPEDIPAIKRRLIQLVNDPNGISSYTRDPSTSQSTKMVKTKDDSGITKIAPKKGATMIDMGLPKEQIQSYVDRILPILDYAQKKKVEVVWG